MKQDLILSLQGLWYSRHGDTWEVSQERPKLNAPSRILTDFEGAPAGVMTIDSKPDFAAAVIEKRLRSEGLIDGEARVLTHRVIPTGGGCTVLYTAVPVVSWHAMFAWLGHQQYIGQVFSIDAAMLTLAQRHDAVLCRTGSQFRFLASHGNTLVYVATTAFSEDPDDLDTAILNLVNQVDAQWQSRKEQTTVLWCDLLASGDDDARLVQLFTQRLNVKIERAPVSRANAGGKTIRTAAETIVSALSWHTAVNPMGDRLAAAADQFRRPIAAAAAAVGIALFVVALYWTAQVSQVQAKVEQMRHEAEKIRIENAGLDLPPEQLLVKHAETFNFLDSVSGAVRGPDPFGFLTDLRYAADQRVRVMRVRLAPTGGSFRIDGVPAAGASGDRPLAAFLAALTSRGYLVTSEDPGGQSQQPGFFSYSIRRISDGVAR